MKKWHWGPRGSDGTYHPDGWWRPKKDISKMEVYGIWQHLSKGLLESKVDTSDEAVRLLAETEGFLYRITPKGHEWMSAQKQTD